MRRVEWSNEARAELKAITITLIEASPQAARLVVRRIGRAIDGLRYFNTGRAGRVNGTFEKLVRKTPYVLA